VRRALWLYWVLTTISTVYFGWHYLLDDLAGLAIGIAAVWVGAKVTGSALQVQYDRHDTGERAVGAFPHAGDAGDTMAPAEHDIAPA
jgi:PAP2 superfamily